MNFFDAQVYCGTVKKYAEGNINGKWMKLSDYKNAEAQEQISNQDKHGENYLC